jgi:hypothetical protein
MYKVTIIDQAKTISDIKVKLHKLHITKDFTRLFLTIENTSDVVEDRLFTSRTKAIQKKKQFEHMVSNIYSRYTTIKSKIPPGVEETGIIYFQRLDNTEDDVKFLLPFNNHTFVFDVKLSNSLIEKSA